MSIYSIGVSGLNAAQIALQTTSSNISNVNTPGYNRQVTLLNDASVGGGIEVADVQRQFDSFISAQMNYANSGLSYLSSYEVQINQLDNLLADQDAGLAPLMQNFFASVSDLAASPSDPAARQGLLGAASTLTAQFRSIGKYLDDMQSGINTQISEEIDAVNNTAALIAKLNSEISIARARTGEEPNALMNQRDQLVTQLSENLNVKVYEQDGGSYNLVIGNGQPLVFGNESYELVAIASSREPNQTAIGYKDSGGNVLELSQSIFSGGEIGGLLAFRSETLDSLRSNLGRLATSLASSFNAQHQLGLDVNGDPGSDFFSIGSPSVFSNSSNLGSASFAIDFSDTMQLSGADYDLRVLDAVTGEFSISRQGTKESFTATLDASNQLVFDGVTLTLDDPSLLVDGDKFSAFPTRYLTSSINVSIQDISQIAAGQIGGSGDNLNALALEDLQFELLVGGSTTLNKAYAALVVEVGNQTNIIQINQSAQAGITAQMKAIQQSQSGVNLDEEAANLIRFQQYYQANARVIETGSTIIDTLLGLR